MESEPVQETTAQAAPEAPAQAKQELTRPQLFAALGERLYLIDKLQAEAEAIRRRLEGAKPEAPPQETPPAQH
jgi:hypothetical protein